MKIEIGKRAQGQVRRASKWWQEHTEHPLLFEREFEDALIRLQRIPGAGCPYPTKRRPHLMRILLAKTEYHVYYCLERNKSVVVIHSVWGARRGRGPKL